MSRFPVTIRLQRRRLLSTAAPSSFDVDLVAENYAQRTQWAGSNYGNRGQTFRMILPPPNVTGKLHLGHALTVAVEDSLCRHHRIKGAVAKWLPGFDHAGIATQSVVERLLWQEKRLTRAQIPKEEFLNHCHAWSKENSQVILKQLNRLGATLDWDSCYYTLDETYSDAVTRAFCELHEQELIYRSRRLVNWCPTLRSSLSDQEVERRDVVPGSTITIPAPGGGKRQVEVGRMYTIRYPLNCAFVDVGTTRPETIFADVALAVHPEDPRYAHLIGSRVRHPLLHEHQLPVIADSAVLPDKGTGILKITPAHDFLDFEIASRNWDSILTANSEAASRSCIDENGRLCGLAPEEYQGLDRFEARSRVVNQLQTIGLLAREQKHAAGQISVCSRTGDVIEPRMTEQWFMNTREMHKEAEKAIRAGQIKITPSFHEGKLFDWLANEDPWCLSRQLVWGHQIPAYQSSKNSKWISARTNKEAVEKLGTEQIRRDEDVLDTWFSSSLAPLVTAGWMKPDFKATDVQLNLMETGWDILGFWVVRMIIMTQRLVGQNPFGKVMLHGLIRDPNGRKMSKSLGNVIDPMDVLDGISLPKMLDRIQESGLSETEKEVATKDLKTRYPEGIPKSGADALRFALLRHDVLATDISLNVVELAAEGQRFCNKLWNLANYMETVAAKCPKQKEVDSETMADRWIMSRLAQTLQIVDSHMAARAPHLAFNTLHQFILGQVCDVYLETTKKALWNDNACRLYEIRTTLTRVLQPTLVQLSVFMPFVSEHLYERIFRREPGSIYFDFVKASMMIFHRDEELEEIFDVALAAVSAVRSVRQQLQLPAKMEFEGILVSRRPNLEEIAPVVRDLGGLRLKTVVVKKSEVPEGLIACTLPASNDLLALKIEDEYRDDFLLRLQRILEKAEQRRDQFQEKARKYEEFVLRDTEDQKRPTIIEKSRRKAQQAASVAKSCQDEIDRMSLTERFDGYDQGAKAWMELYQQLVTDAAAVMQKNKLTKKIAQSRANMDKNRYTNVLPYDQNRVKLLGENDYINASFVTVPNANRNYILSQGPVEESLSDFWQMIFENNVPAIVMLNRLFEGGSMKCEKYFSCQQNPTMCFEPYTVHLESEKKLNHFISRKFLVKHNETEEERQVYQVQYTEWPDFGVPESTAHFLEMLEHLKSLEVLSTKSDDAPVVIHCSAGIGRSGTFVLTDSVLRMAEIGVPETEIDPNNLLVELRSQRSGLIQTPEQLQFAWKAIVDGLKKYREASGDATISSSSHDLLKKRKSETQEDIDERLAKRREMISNMVRKNHQAEEAAAAALRKHRKPPSLFNNRSVIVGGVVAVASIFAYYYFRQ